MGLWPRGKSSLFDSVYWCFFRSYLEMNKDA